jgi:hypothetical protein
MLLCSLACSCRPQADQREALKLQTSKSLEQQLTDSLRKYIHLTAFQLETKKDSLSCVLYGKQLKANKIGIVAIYDSVLLLYQVVNRKLNLASRIHFRNIVSDVEEADLNGDDKSDLIIYGSPNMHGQAEPFVFLQRDSITWKYRPDIKMYDVSYDPDKKLVRAYYSASGYSVMSKELYRWDNDSLRQIAGVDYEPWKPLVTSYLVKSGKRYAFKWYRSTAVADTILFQAPW